VTRCQCARGTSVGGGVRERGGMRERATREERVHKGEERGIEQARDQESLVESDLACMAILPNSHG